MWNTEIAALAAAHKVDPDRWWAASGALIDRIAPRFARYEPLRHAAGLMLGMLDFTLRLLGPALLAFSILALRARTKR